MCVLVFLVSSTTKMPLTHSAVRRAVLRRMSAETLHIIEKFVRKQKPQLWGTKKSETYVVDCILVALFKDLFAKGYTSLFLKIKKWMPTSHHTTTQHQGDQMSPWKVGQRADSIGYPIRLENGYPVLGLFKGSCYGKI